jgi:hypothetical protein
VIAQFAFRIVLSVAFATRGLSHLLPPWCQQRSIPNREGTGLSFLEQFYLPGLFDNGRHGATRMRQLGRGSFHETLAMITKSIPTYREDQHPRDRDAQVEIEDAARIEPAVSLC